MNDYNLKKVLCQLNQWCATNNISVQSVYDECHGMTLQEIVYYLLGVVKEAVNQVVENTDAFNELESKFNDLYNFVNNYFDNLNVQDEINNKLDQMAENGTLSDLLNGHFLPSGNCTPSIAQKIYKTGMTYFENNYTGLIYAHFNEGGNAMDYKNGPTYGYSEESPDHQGYYINCACLTNLLLLGTPYQYSMYNTQNGLHNKIGMGGYKSLLIPDINSETYTEINYTSAMAKRFREKGQGFWCKYPFNDIQIGDVLFFFDPDSGSGDRLNDTKHCNIVVAVTPNDWTTDETCTMFITIDATGGDHPVSILHWEMNDLQNFTSDNLIYVGRPTYSEIGGEATPELLGMYNITSVTKNIDNLHLVGGRVLTLEFDYTPSNNDEYVSLSCNGGGISYMIQNATTANTNMIGNTIHLKVPISLNLLGNETELDSLTLTCINGAYQDIGVIKVYEGVMGSKQSESYTVSNINDILNIGLKNNGSYINVRVPESITGDYNINSGFYILTTVQTPSGTIISLNSYEDYFNIYYNDTIVFIGGNNNNPKVYTVEEIYNLPSIFDCVNAQINFGSGEQSTGYLQLLGNKAIFLSTVGMYMIDKINQKFKLISSYD